MDGTHRRVCLRRASCSTNRLLTGVRLTHGPRLGPSPALRLTALRETVANEGDMGIIAHRYAMSLAHTACQVAPLAATSCAMRRTAAPHRQTDGSQGARRVRPTRYRGPS